MKSNKFSIKSRLKSFTYAWNGLKILLKEEHNSRIHLVGAIIAMGLSFFFKISTFEWIAVIFSIGFVFAMELLNSALENLADFATTEKNEMIKKAKDLAAGGVLIAAITAGSIGCIIFAPKIWLIL